MSVLHAPLRTRIGNSPAVLCTALAMLLLFGSPTACFGTAAALRILRPGFCSNCGPDPYTGNVMLSFADPVPTRGWPLVNNIHLNTQCVEPTRMMRNATFTYDIHVTTGTIYVNGQGSIHRIVVDGTGRMLDFGATSGGIAAEPGVFSTLTLDTDHYVLSNAGPPESIDQAGNFRYLFNTTGQLTQITDPMGNTQSLTYANGILAQVNDYSTGKQIAFVSAPNSYVIYHGAWDGISSNWTATEQVIFSGGNLVEILWSGSGGAVLKRVDYTYYPSGPFAGMLQTYTKDGDPATTITYSYTPLPPTGGTSQVMMANQTAAGGPTAEGSTHLEWN